LTPKLLIIALAFQVLFTAFFLADSIISILDLRTTPIDWQVKELLDIAAALGLLIGAVLGAIAIQITMNAKKRAEDGLRAASGAFHEMVEERFEDWGLSAAERDITLLTLKGLSIREIAAIRKTSEGTIKSQSNAIYKKAEVKGRGQLQSLFVEDLMDGVVPAKTD